MRIITCASYHGSGSSAVTDLLSEFECVKSLTNYEINFVFDSDGISDLEYNLVENPNRFNSSHALKRFKRLVDYYGDHWYAKRYEPFFHGQWKKMSYEYIDQLTDFKYKAVSKYDYTDRGQLFEFLSKVPNQFLQRTIWRNKEDRYFHLLKNEITYASHPSEEKFLTCTKQYIENLFTAANPNNSPYVMVDQVVPSSNTNRYIRYFNDIKVVVVDRDPRDVYLLSKCVWKDKDVPNSDPDSFCKWFEYCRFNRSKENWDAQRVKLVRFEDLIYRYEETKNEIVNWLGVSTEFHKYPKKYLDPEKSINNTRIWEKYPQYSNDLNIIKRLLPQYLYNYNELGISDKR